MADPANDLGEAATLSMRPGSVAEAYAADRGRLHLPERDP
jgi:hypothetical protein